MSRILLLEDDASLIDGLQYALGKNGFEVDVARTVAEGRALLAQNAEVRRAEERNAGVQDTEERNAETRKPEFPPYELLLLDVTLPDGTGFEICEVLRREGSGIPIIFLTAADEETSIIRGLDLGGDDYITKPFRLGELCSRIRALLRRSGRAQGQQEESRYEERTGAGRLSAGREDRLNEERRNDRMQGDGRLQVDLAAVRVFLDGKPLELTGAEYRLLCLFMKNAGRTLTRGRILDALWDGNGSFVDDNTLSVYIRRLREKIERDPSSPEYLLTVRGIGYQWRGGQI